MKRMALMLVLTFAVGIAIGVTGTQVLNAQYAQQQEPGSAPGAPPEVVAGGPCPDNCEKVCKNQKCSIITWGVSGSEWATPDHELVYTAALEALSKLGDIREGGPPVPGTGDVATEQAKNLQEIAKLKKPSVWLKGKWQHCELVKCRYGFLWLRTKMRRDWVDKTAWVRVDVPSDVPSGLGTDYAGKSVWPPVSDWRPDGWLKVVQDAVKEKAKKFLEDCENDVQYK